LTRFRALAYVERGACRLVSRNNHDFRSFPGLCDGLAAALGNHDAILDGEIVCLDHSGRARFNALLYRRQEPYYYAFGCLWLDGRDLRQLPLVERKQILQTLVPAQPARLLYVSHIEEHGVDLFQEVCRQDLEGVVAKLMTAPYETEPPSWVKIKNREYSQAAGRHEQFEEMRARRATPGSGGRVRLR
jgi:bifunctional non-homologous end joining protein LigD